ncbi:MAG: replication protein RepA, partial [Methylacidiphilaceae bacterium]|nr:replication protein RepA [Candidatus Methylacidiphilaceae bacterium]
DPGAAVRNILERYPVRGWEIEGARLLIDCKESDWWRIELEARVPLMNAGFSYIVRACAEKSAAPLAVPGSSRPPSDLAYSVRSLVECSMPLRPFSTYDEKRKEWVGLIYERRNCSWALRMEGSPNYGLPFGKDRVVLLYLCKRALRDGSKRVVIERASEILTWLYGRPADQLGGNKYRDLKNSLMRLGHTKIVYGQDKADLASERFFLIGKEVTVRRAEDGRSPDPAIVFEFSDQAWEDLVRQPIAISSDLVRAYKNRPLQLSLLQWLTHRLRAHAKLSVPLLGAGGLFDQLGMGLALSPRTNKADLRRALEGAITGAAAEEIEAWVEGDRLVASRKKKK